MADETMRKKTGPYMNGSADFGTTIIRPSTSTPLYRNVRAWEDPENPGDWFIEALPSEIQQTQWSRIPPSPGKKLAILHLDKGVKLTQKLGQPAEIERLE